jgi:SprT protein
MSSHSDLLITPIDSAMQQKVTDEVQRYLLMAESLYKQSFAPIEVLFDIKGRVAGMYRVASARNRWGGLSLSPPHRIIRFNPWLFAKYPEDSWKNTLPHEVAHYLADCLYGLRSIRPHGKEWQRIMLDLGAKPIVRANYDLTGVPTRNMRSYAYYCQCRKVSLSRHRHNKIIRGLQRYRCRDCAAELVLAPA